MGLVFLSAVFFSLPSKSRGNENKIFIHINIWINYLDTHLNLSKFFIGYSIIKLLSITMASTHNGKVPSLDLAFNQIAINVKMKVNTLLIDVVKSSNKN